MEHEPGCACCSGMDFDEVARHIDATIAARGFAIQLVSGGRGEPGFAYTIGLAEKGLPEYAFIGAGDPGAAPYVVCFAAAAMAGQTPAIGLHERLTEPNGFAVPVILAEADEKLASHAFGVAARLRRLGIDTPARLVQVVMPDMHGRFPWHPAYDWVDQQVPASARG